MKVASFIKETATQILRQNDLDTVSLDISFLFMRDLAGETMQILYSKF